MTGPAGHIPDVTPGAVVSGSFRSEHRLGAETGWSVIYPRAQPEPLPVLVALHGLHSSHRTWVDDLGVDRFLAAAVKGGVPPFAIAAVDGGTTYWHPRPDGEDAGAMVVDEFLPLLARRGLRTERLGFHGYSMGGYGALRLAGLRGAAATSAVVASSPALWSDADTASRSGFADAEEYDAFAVFHDQERLTGIPVRVDVGTGDPFYRDVEDYVAGFPDGSSVTSTFQPGGHTTGYWRRLLPAPS
jgi:enterochelin esterase-like enzyme